MNDCFEECEMLYAASAFLGALGAFALIDHTSVRKILICSCAIDGHFGILLFFGAWDLVLVVPLRFNATF